MKRGRPKGSKNKTIVDVKKTFGDVCASWDRFKIRLGKYIGNNTYRYECVYYRMVDGKPVLMEQKVRS